MTIQLQGIIYCLVQFPIIFSYFAGIMLNAHAFSDPLCSSFKIGRSLISSKEIVHKLVLIYFDSWFKYIFATGS